MVRSSAAAAPEGSEEEGEGRLLDGFLLLAAGGSSSPEDVVSVNLSSLQIVDVADEDLTFFVNLDRLDVSDNQLSHEDILRQMGRLPRLTSLSLACNSINALQVSDGALRYLQSLDLSFNGLHGDVLAQLAFLPGLVTLNLSSNCISLVPPEGEICGLQSLEELILDNNDLVQFVQWRALDALPRLKKLSLASNRVKRLKDDEPDTPDSDLSYFSALEDLDLSSNEIATCESLPVVQLFLNLQVLRLSNNPCMKGSNAAAQKVPGVNIYSQHAKEWYLCGSGCFQRRVKSTEPHLKLNRKKMRRVRSSPQVGPLARRRSSTQLCVYDHEANQLLVSLQHGSGPEKWDLVKPGEKQQSYAIVPASAPAVLADDMSDGELEQMFRERRANLDRKFAAPVEEPTSFMKPPPFTASIALSTKLARASAPDDEAAAAAPPRQPSKSTLFALTSVGDELADVARPPARAKVNAPSQPKIPGESTTRPRQAESPSPASPGSVTLPPIQAGSRGSSAGGGSRAGVGARGEHFAGGRPPPPVPDIGVREAIRALRAAAMSEYAVAA